MDDTNEGNGAKKDKHGKRKKRKRNKSSATTHKTSGCIQDEQRSETSQFIQDGDRRNSQQQNTKLKRQREDSTTNVSGSHRKKKRRKNNNISVQEEREPRSQYVDSIDPNVAPELPNIASIDGETGNAPNPSIDENVKLKKKKAKKKRKKKKSNEVGIVSVERGDNVTNDEEDGPSTSELEGCLNSDNEMVLIDRANQKVYSGVERLANDNLKQIGTLDTNGKIVLFKNTERHGDHNDDLNDDRKLVDSNDGDLSQPEADDHCESPIDAYRDIVPMLRLFDNMNSRARQDSTSSPCIYDPYYCNGAVIKNLETLGFPNIYNRKEDCYSVWDTCSSADGAKSKNSDYPSFDVLVTNPPYSGDHIEKLIDHVTTSQLFGSRPWFLLLPQFVHKKDYYIQKTRNIRPFYMVPRKRYVYLPPPTFRESKKSDVHKKSSPFVSMWYVWGGTPSMTERLLGVARGIATCDVARSKSALRDLRRSSQQQKKR